MKKYILLILTIFSTLGTIGWILTDSFGGMIIYALDHTYLISSIILVYFITLIITLVKLVKTGFKKNKLIAICHALVFIFSIAYGLLGSEIFKARKIYEATLYDDLSNINILLREDNTFKTTTYGMFGYVDRYHGKYSLHGDTLIFLDEHYSNDYISDTLLISIRDSAIFFSKNKLGEFKMTKDFASYFDLHKLE